MAVLAVIGEDAAPTARNRIRTVTWEGTNGNDTTEQRIYGKLLAIEFSGGSDVYDVTISNGTTNIFVGTGLSITANIDVLSLDADDYAPIPCVSTLKCTLANLAAGTVVVKIYYEVY